MLFLFFRGLDFAPVNSSHLKSDTPIIVVQHGLTGGKDTKTAPKTPLKTLLCDLTIGSYESYVRAILCRTCAPVKEGGLGYRAVVVNFRGCTVIQVLRILVINPDIKVQEFLLQVNCCTRAAVQTTYTRH